MIKNQVVFEEYTKDIFPHVNGNGAVLHSITSSCQNPRTAEVIHSFGKDECLNKFIDLKKICEINKVLKENLKNSDYNLFFFSKDSPNKEIAVRELKSDKKEIKFKVFWKKTFGNKEKVSYIWGWINNVMFSTFHYPEGHHSLVRIVYPTKKLIFRINFPEMYPLENKPFVIMIDEKGKENKIAETIEIKSVKVILPLGLGEKVVDKTFKVTIDNPIQGNTYKLVWKIGFENLSNYLDWLESRI